MAENYITRLKRENAELKEKLEQTEEKKVEVKPVVDEKDYRHELIEIVYGANANSMKSETMPAEQGFKSLVNYYSNFNLATNRNVRKEWNDPISGDSLKCNDSTVFAKITYRDLRQKKEVSTVRDLPLWVAVDYVVQQGRKVELISQVEFDAWYKESQLKDLRSDNTYKQMKQKVELENMLKEELQG